MPVQATNTSNGPVLRMSTSLEDLISSLENSQETVLGRGESSSEL
jgi:hypothetical protein